MREGDFSFPGEMKGCTGDENQKTGVMKIKKQEVMKIKKQEVMKIKKQE